MKENLIQLKSAVLLLLALTALFGILYPWGVTSIAEFLFPNEANGSLILKNEKVIGSKLIGQNFTDAKYFWGRPSATPSYPYNALHSSGSNLGPTNPALFDSLKTRIALLQNSDPGNILLIPVDLVTSSGSGLDPEISVDAAYYQAHRVAKARGLSEKTVRTLIENNIQPRQFGFLGERRVNVLELNLSLEKIKQ